MSISIAHVFVLAAAVSLSAPRADAGICVDVNLHAASAALSHDLVVALEHEATAIWARYDVELRWQVPMCAVEDASFDVLIARHLARASQGRVVLGSTQVQLTLPDQVPILIDYDATETTLASLTVSALTASLGRQRIGPDEMGRALGRVAAHEIGHVLLALPNHQRQGLMRESFQAIDMVLPLRAQYTLSAIEIARLRHRSNWIVSSRSHAEPPDLKDELLHSRPRQDTPEDPGKAIDRTKR